MTNSIIATQEVYKAIKKSKMALERLSLCRTPDHQTKCAPNDSDFDLLEEALTAIKQVDRKINFMEMKKEKSN